MSPISNEYEHVIVDYLEIKSMNSYDDVSYHFLINLFKLFISSFFGFLV